jgi:hypothetical protein
LQWRRASPLTVSLDVDTGIGDTVRVLRVEPLEDPFPRRSLLGG